MTLHSSQSSQPGLAGIHPQWVEALAHYDASPSAYDELLREGGVREHWLPLLRQPLEGARGAPSARGGSPERRRDALPFIIAAEEWRSIEAGLEQRARLLNAINTDFYGAQRLLREQGFPPALVFANRRYLPACRPGFSTSGATLGLLAFDLGRAPDGGWRVLANRTETPTGLGLALQNRFQTASLLNVAAQEAAIPSLDDVLNGFSAEVRQRGQATGAPRESLCVVLAGDATQPDYADWRPLSERLGFPLLEGNDLAVRGGSVFAKTLKGLKSVAAILRLVESDRCDPLTLSPTSLAGAPGLLNAATQRGVAVINPIGCGAVESDALNPFLPALCEHLLDEALLLPSLATWWCGQRQEAAQVLEQLDQLAVGEAFCAPCGLDADPTPTKPDAAPDEVLREAIQAQPYRFAGREPISLSCAPCLMPDGQLMPAPLTLRLFAAATPSGYRVLPGGLARMAGGLSALVKDVWIAETSRAPIHRATSDLRASPELAPLPTRQPEASQDAAALAAVADAAAVGSAIITRRLGDDLFWFGRYLERAQTAIRIFTALARLIAEGRPSNAAAGQELLQLLASLGFTVAADGRSAEAFNEAGFCRLLFDAASDDALINLLERLQLTGRRRRGTLPAAAWQVLESTHQAQQSRWRVHTLASALRLLDGLALRLAAVTGLMDETQPRDQGFWLQRLGKHIERLRLLAAINVEFGVAQASMDPNRLHLLLQLHSLSETQAAWTADAGAALHRLVCDADNPKSMRHQAERIGRCLERLFPQGLSKGLTEVRNCASALGNELADVCRRAGVGADEETRQLLRSANARTGELSALVSAMWFEPQAVPDDGGSLG